MLAQLGSHVQYAFAERDGGADGPQHCPVRLQPEEEYMSDLDVVLRRLHSGFRFVKWNTIEQQTYTSK